MSDVRQDSGEMDRREFGRLAVAGLAGLAGVAAGGRAAETDGKRVGEAASGNSPSLAGLRRVKKGDIYYRPLGATGLWISELALGGSPSPPLNVFRAALERGVNFCDTSPRYSRGKGEQEIGQAIQGRRDRVYVSTKITPNRDGVFTAGDAVKQVEGSLKRLGTDCIDVLCVHGAASEKDVFADWVLEAVDRLKQAGKARYFGASVHNTSLEFNRKMIESGRYQVLLMPLNAYFEPKMQSGDGAGTPETLRSILRLAAQKGVGIIAMKTLAAGGLAKVPAAEGISPVQARLRWVLRRPEVTSVLNEMVTFDYLKEDLAASAADLSPAEEAYLRECVRDGSAGYCRMCRKCEAGCPAGIPIADLLRARMYTVDYGDPRRGMDLGSEMGAARLLASCQGCGRCEATCPWGVRTSRLFGELRELVS